MPAVVDWAGRLLRIVAAGRLLRAMVGANKFKSMSDEDHLPSQLDIYNEPRSFILLDELDIGLGMPYTLLIQGYLQYMSLCLPDQVRMADKFGLQIIWALFPMAFGTARISPCLDGASF